MITSLLPTTTASRYCARWQQADAKRPAQVTALAQQALGDCDFAPLLAEQMANGLPMPRAMRRLRNLLQNSLIERDLTGRADVAEVMQAISRFADFCIQTLLQNLHSEQCALYGTPIGHESGTEQTMLVIGMGKLGAHELNVSSDIDLIFIYAEDGDTQTSAAGQKSLSNHEFFIRLGKKLIAAIDEIGEDGFCFRVDMALRPNGKSGPLVASLNMLEEYLIVQGREWERYAWVKARAITGSDADIAALDAIVRPFVYRRYLDFGVIDSLRNMHAQIRAEVSRQERLHPDRSNNVKLGRGGIREIEFLAQVFQLIRGGREAHLRQRGTRDTLNTLAEKELLRQDEVQQLQTSYAFLRNLEHRLQYMEDAQTHTLPANPDDLLRVAQMMGMRDSATLLKELEQHRQYVAGQFDAMFAEKTDKEGRPEANKSDELVLTGKDDPQEAVEARMQAIGYPDAAECARRLLAAWHSPRLQSMPERSRNRLQALLNTALPMITQNARNEKHISAILGRVLDFFETIARRSAYLSLLTEYPHTLRDVVQMVSASHWAAQFLTRHPIVLDEMLDERLRHNQTNWAELGKDLQQQLAESSDDTERQLDILREVHHAQMFRLLAQDLAGELTVEILADHLSALADTIVQATLDAIWASLPNRHRERPRFAVIAYGRLGGKELGYSSDLDVIFLFDDDEDVAAMLYMKLAQRFISWMTTHTAAGILFDIDTALRPDGASGMLVSSLSAFERYQHHAAWMWEHQALSRARFCAGDTAIGARFEAIREEVLCKQKDQVELKTQVLSMRQKMRAANANKGGAMFDIKQDAGGMIDLEFMVQYLVLLHAPQYPSLRANLGNIKILKILANLNLIDANLGKKAADAYRKMRRLQHQIRLQGESHARVELAAIEQEVGDVLAAWQSVFG